MFKILAKTLDVEIHPNKFVRLIRNFDGSMTQCIKSLTNQNPKVQLLYEGPIQYPETLVSLQMDENVPKIQRIIKLKLQQGDKCLLIGRTIWLREAYEKIMEKDKLKPIGQNLLDQKVQYFKEVTWSGNSTIELGKTIYEDIQARSSRYYNGGKTMCNVQEYMTEGFFEMFK